jgi:hypothetical protein
MIALSVSVAIGFDVLWTAFAFTQCSAFVEFSQNIDSLPNQHPLPNISTFVTSHHYITLYIMKSRNILLGLLLLLSVPAATLLWNSHTATLRSRDTRTSAITWSQCNLDFGDEMLNRGQKAYDCAKLSVPLDYTNENSSQPLVLDLIRANAISHPYKGSVFYNPGGPSASGVSGVIEMGDRLVGVLGGHYDVISFDPR